METMSWQKILFTGIPETLVLLLTGLILCYGGGFFRKNMTVSLIKLILSTAVVLTVVYFSRKIVGNVMLHSLITMSMYFITFIFVWQMNIRQSILATFINLFTLTTLEVITFPLYDRFAQYIGLTNYYESSIIFVQLIRLIQIMIIILLIKFNFKNSELLTKNWNKLKWYYQIAIGVILLSVFLSMAVLFNYLDIIIKINTYHIDTSLISLNLKLFFWMNIWMFFVLVGLVWYIYKFTEAKDILEMSPEEMLEIFRRRSTEEEIENYIKILQRKEEEGGKCECLRKF